MGYRRNHERFEQRRNGARPLQRISVTPGGGQKIEERERNRVKRILPSHRYHPWGRRGGWLQEGPRCNVVRVPESFTSQATRIP